MFDEEREPDYQSIYRNKVVLITGPVGTVGSELLKQIIMYDPLEVRLFDTNESGLFMQTQTYKHKVNLLSMLGDIKDDRKLFYAMEGTHIVFHVAAYKHVELCEYNPFEAVHTNVIGTQNVLNAAMRTGVERVLYTSSDKAVNPTNVMGTSKLLAERMVTASSIRSFNGKPRHIFASTRFGNVLGSNGSVIPVFWEQIKKGGPVTITDMRMTRFIMTVPESVKLVIKAAALACGGEVFVTKMPVVRIIDLAEAMIDLLAPLYGYDPADIPIEFIGVKPGEKLYEELMSEEETSRAVELEDMFSVLPNLIDRKQTEAYQYHGFVSGEVKNPYISRNEKIMKKEEIADYLRGHSILGEEYAAHTTASVPLHQNLTVECRNA
jgi:FlaA1/EpsC-like NDP-sugar epimerase